MTEPTPLSFIEPHEEEEAKRFILEHLTEAYKKLDNDWGRKAPMDLPRASGYHMYVKLFVRDEDVGQLKDDKGNLIIDATGRPVSIIIPESVRANDKYSSCVGLVIAQGPEAYQGERFKKSGPWCKVGDWIIFPRNEGTQILYRRIPMHIIPDDRCLGIVSDPTYVTRD